MYNFLLCLLVERCVNEWPDKRHFVSSTLLSIFNTLFLGVGCWKTNAILNTLLFAFRCILWPNPNPRLYLPGHSIYGVTFIHLIPLCYRIGEIGTLIKSSLTLFDRSELQNILYTLAKTEANFPPSNTVTHVKWASKDNGVEQTFQLWQFCHFHINSEKYSFLLSLFLCFLHLIVAFYAKLLNLITFTCSNKQ